MTDNLFFSNLPEAAEGSEAKEPNHGEANGGDSPALNAEDYFRIGEVCRLTGTKAFVLRYWETEFPMLAPHKNPRGHRAYRREDVDMVFEIKRLLYEQGFTIAGARRWLESREAGMPEAAQAAEAAAAPPPVPPGSAAGRKLLVDLEQELRAILTLLKTE